MLHSLTSLTLGNSDAYRDRCGISEEGVVAISRHLSTLEELNISTHSIIVDENNIGQGAESIAKHHLGLTKLWIGINRRNLDDCGIGSHSFIYLVSRLKQLKLLSVGRKHAS